MNSTQVLDCTSTSLTNLERVLFRNGQLIAAEDMTTDRDYFLQKLRRHNRFLHGWGVVCGLPVTAAPVSAKPWQVQVGSGYALGPYGDEIFLSEAVNFDLAACLTGGITSPCEPNVLLPGAAGTSTIVYLAIKYSECLARPVRLAYSGCGCEDGCDYSRICDSFQLQCLPKLPEQPPPSRVTLCDIRNGVVAPCPPCPTNPWVVLAKITLPSLSSLDIADPNINMSVRRTIVSTAVLQDQVIRCCCGREPPPPPPPPSQVFLKDILVRPSSFKAVGVLPWSPSTKLPNSASPQSFDFKLDLTGPAPMAGLPVTVTAGVPSTHPEVTVTLTPPDPIVVVPGTSTHETLGNFVTFHPKAYRDTIKITLTANDGTKTVTATLLIDPP
jgi:hypothetical protein